MGAPLPPKAAFVCVPLSARLPSQSSPGRVPSSTYGIRIPSRLARHSRQHIICSGTNGVSHMPSDTLSTHFTLQFSSPDDAYLHSHNLPFEHPVLIYFPGLDARALPHFQAERLRAHYTSISLIPCSGLRAGWDDLASSAVAALRQLRTPPSLIIAESFGAALALRLVARHDAPKVPLILLNPATSLSRRPLLSALTSALPALGISGQSGALYALAARILRLLLLDEYRLHEDARHSLPPGLAVDVTQVPLGDVIYKVRLLRQFENNFGDLCLSQLVNVPVTLVAAEKDRLLGSVQEAERLKTLLPFARDVVVLPHSAHAALLERDVDIRKIIAAGAENDKNSKLYLNGKGDRIGIPERNFSQRDENRAEKEHKEFRRAYALGSRILAPWRAAVSPHVEGLSHVRSALRRARKNGLSQRPVLFVGNHSVYGLLDLPLLVQEIQSLLPNGTHLRSLAHDSHFNQFGAASNGRWTAFVRALGGVPATPRNFYALLRAAHATLLFPGGAREVCRRRGEAYRLFWRERTDFVRPAAKFNALIVPFSAVGADDACDILIDGQELQKLPAIGRVVQNALDRTGMDRENLMPVSMPPKLGRFYFRFHKAIDTQDVDCRNADQCQKIYEEAKMNVEQGVSDLLHLRETDPLRGFSTRAFTSFFQFPDFEL